MPTRRFKKPYRAKRKKPLYAKASFWRVICLVTLAGGAFWVVCFSSVFEVKEIKVTGTQKVSDQDCIKVIQEEINKKIAFADSKSILLFNLEQTKKDLLSRFPQIQDIKIESHFPSKIYASVQERSGVAIFIDGSGKRYLVDANGVAFEPAADQTGLLEIAMAQATSNLETGAQAITARVLDSLLRVKGDIQSSANISIQSAVISTPERINLKTAAGWFIYFNPLKDIDQQILKLQSVLVDDSLKSKIPNLEYLDIRFTRVYLKEKQIAPITAPVPEPTPNQQTAN